MPRVVGVLAFAMLLLTGCQAHRGPGPQATAPVSDEGYLLYQARLEGAGKARRFRIALAVRHPDRFRLEIVGPVGGPRLVLISDGTLLQASLPPKRAFAVGPADAQTLEILTGLPMAPREFLDLLLGFPRSGGVTSRATSRVLFQAGRGIAVNAEFAAGTGEAQSLLQVTYGDETTGPWGTQALDLIVRHGVRELSLHLKDASEGPVKKGTFAVEPPARFSEWSLDDFATAGTNLFAMEEDS